MSSLSVFINRDRIQSFLSKACEDFNNTGICIIENFLSNDIAEGMTEEVLSDPSVRYNGTTQHNIYQRQSDSEYPNDHIRNKLLTTSCTCIPNDKIPKEGMLSSLFDSDDLKDFVSVVTSQTKTKNPNLDSAPKLYRYADPLAALTINVIGRDDVLNWHFDQAPFVVILLLQNSESGGHYEVLPESLTTADGSLDYNAHESALLGENPSIVRHRFPSGTLIIHQGHHSLHRVSPVIGDVLRVSALLTYSNKENDMLDDHLRVSYYGRSS